MREDFICCPNCGAIIQTMIENDAVIHIEQLEFKFDSGGSCISPEEAEKISSAVFDFSTQLNLKILLYLGYLKMK